MSIGFQNGLLYAPAQTLSPYVVGSDTQLYAYQNIQAAIDDAVLDGASSANVKNVYVAPKSGAYAEAISMKDGINLIGLAASNAINDIVIEPPGGNDAVTLPSTGTMAMQNLLIRGVSGQDCITMPSPTGQIFLHMDNCQADGITNSANRGIFLDNQSTGNPITCLAYRCDFKGGTVDAEIAEGVNFNALGYSNFNGGVKSLTMTDDAAVTLQDSSCTQHITCVGTSNLTMLFGGLNTGSANASLTCTGSSQAVLAMVQIQPLAGQSAIKIGAGATVNALYVPMIVSGATHAVDENAPADAGAFNRGACFALGPVSSVNGTLTSTSFTAI